MSPSAYMLDFGRLRIDGNELARNFRASFTSPTIPSVTVSGYGQAQSKLAARTAVIYRYSMEQIEPSPLLDRLSELISKN